MPASFGLEYPHLHCTRVHNNGLQTPTSSMCKSTIHARVQQEDTRAPACTRQETRASLLRAPKTCARHASLRAPKDGSAHRRACKDTRATATRDAKMRTSKQLQGCDPVLSLPFF